MFTCTQRYTVINSVQPWQSPENRSKHPNSVPNHHKHYVRSLKSIQKTKDKRAQSYGPTGTPIQRTFRESQRCSHIIYTQIVQEVRHSEPSESGERRVNRRRFHLVCTEPGGDKQRDCYVEIDQRRCTSISLLSIFIRRIEEEPSEQYYNDNVDLLEPELVINYAEGIVLHFGSVMLSSHNVEHMTRKSFSCKTMRLI